jgi:hypothetical protein
MMTLSAPGVFFLMAAMSPPNSWGRFQPVVSGMLRVVAPALITSPRTWYRNSGSDLYGGGGVSARSE